MDRRAFLELLAAAPLVPAARAGSAVPSYRAVSRFAPAAVPGMPGPWPGRVVSVRSPRCLDEAGTLVDADVVREMTDRGMRALTGETTALGAWRRFFEPRDVVGIKVNAGGGPHVVSSPPIVAEICRNLVAVGVPASSIVVFERFRDQLEGIGYPAHLPEGVGVFAAEAGNERTQNRAYDPETYVDVDFFGEEDTRSNMMRLVTGRLTKIVNVPNMKDHGATGVTGCLKNVAYGCFSNVARSHARGQTHTLTAVGTFAAVEPLRSRCVLQIMDGLRAVWHGGPFARTTRYVFHPRRILFGTDPVAIDRLLLDVIDDKRKAEGAISIWDRSPKHLRVEDADARDADPDVNILIREPGHVAYASHLGLGTADLARIRVEEIEV
ncbi:MAG TPA: DUF362 domain-containing protein [Vicinamibacteria bacterium]|nr:DUF362 domain-containing protein [Vicinamibacteria bacterium]